jgi:hypothetical protein
MKFDGLAIFYEDLLEKNAGDPTGIHEGEWDEKTIGPVLIFVPAEAQTFCLG